MVLWSYFMGNITSKRDSISKVKLFMTLNSARYPAFQAAVQVVDGLTLDPPLQTRSPILHSCLFSFVSFTHVKVMTRCFKYSPEERPTFEEINEMLRNLSEREIYFK